MDTPHTSTVEILKSLADDTRLSIIRAIATQNCEVASSDIVQDCALAHKLSQPAMSHHFSKLITAGVLKERKVGVEKYYRLNHELLAAIGIDISLL